MDTPDVITVAQARALGISPKTLRRQTAERHLHGIYSPVRRDRDPSDLHRSLVAAVASGGTDVASHQSAAVL